MSHRHPSTSSDRSPVAAAAAVLAALALAVAACGAGDGSSGAGPPDGEHRLVEGEGPDGALVLDDDAPVTLTIDGEQWGGTAACNSYSATVIADDAQLQVRGVSVTEMGCFPDEVMELERAYLEAFRTVDGYGIDGETLELRGPGTTLVFRARSEVPGGEVVDPAQ